MSCFSGCELHLIKDIIVCYFTKYPPISVICNNKKNYLLINGFTKEIVYSKQIVRLVLSLILTGLLEWVHWCNVHIRETFSVVIHLFSLIDGIVKVIVEVPFCYISFGY